MNYPHFFDGVKKIAMYDPLSEFLGAAEDGVIEYSYLDVIKLAGHSCPTVAGAYLMTQKALAALYGDELPQRGSIRAEFPNSQQTGVTGVIANVVSFITGATTDTGFKGIAGRFDRRNLLFFNAPINAEIRFQRVDTGAEVGASYHADIVPPSPGMVGLMQQILGGDATAEEKKEFGVLWQDRVRRILESADDPRLVVLS